MDAYLVFHSNEPVEDEHVEAVLPVPSGHWTFFGLFDGHSGRDTSVWLADNLVPAITGALADLYTKFANGSPNSASPPAPSESDIEHTLKDTFNRLDDDIVNAPLDTVFSSKSRYAAATLLAPAYSGSCALLSFYDSHSWLLHTAVTGDSRAVLGRQDRDESGQPTGTYSVHVLTADQNGWNPLEQERMAAEHPGEETVRNGRVMGMGMSRAFGDARYKWSREVQHRLKREYLGRTPLPDVKTPPYLTAEPVVTSFAIRPDDFLIMASDGLWEALTNEEAVGLVGLWKNMRSARSHGAGSGVVLESAELPVQLQEHDGTVRYRQWGADKRFVSGDENAATHLLRNALGGADLDLTAALLSMRAPRSRTYRDDIAITVVFFAEDDRRTPT
ncbi:Protein phosphatase 2C -like protein [Trametes pubescens]|uniref:Protein phosphatase 2C-like protein n=1 Tax=Trametes pubescens TaxID=154538 RepID=A0A1M2V328_TRAPU|nr:Protein phosphatase 2C -like protein [Trametes pubescens]